jgi:hypothetical protein
MEQKRDKMRLLLSALLLLSTSVVNGQIAKTINQDDRVLKLPGCTGFMVDGNYIFSAKHCLQGLGKTVYIEAKDGKILEAKLVYVTEHEDGPIVYYLPPHGDITRYRSFKVANAAPKTGETVHSIGFPGGNYAITYGKMAGGNGRTVNYAEMRIQPGNSGGPLLNEKDEIIGITQAVDIPMSSNRSYFCGWGLVAEALKQAKIKTNDIAPDPPKTTAKTVDVVIFTADWCGACQTLDREVPDSDYRSRGLNPIKVKNENGVWTNGQLVSEFRAKTGKDIPGLPTVWIRNTDQYQTGYSTGSRLSLFGWIIKGVKSIGTLIFGNGPDGSIVDEPPSVPGPRNNPNVAPAPPSEVAPPFAGSESSPVPPPPGQDVAPPPNDDPPKPAEPVVEEIDWENVSIVIAIKKQLEGYRRETIAKISLKVIGRLVSQANAEFFDGKANIEIVDERTQPIRYESFKSAIGVEPEPVYVMVLVKKQSLGLKSLIAGKVERSILEKVPEGTPVEIIFERIQKQDYENITQSLEVRDTVVIPPTEEETTRDVVVGALKDEVAGLKGELKGLVIPSKDDIVSGVISNVGPAIEELQNSQNEDGEDRSFFQRLIAGLLALIGAGQATGGVRGFLKARMMKKLGQAIGTSKTEPSKPVE